MKIAQVEIKRTFSHHTVNEFQRLKCQIKAEASRNYILKTVWRLITPVRRYALPKFENPLRRGNHAQLKIENPLSSFLFSSSVGVFDQGNALQIRCSSARVDLFFADRLRDRSSPCPDFAVQVTARLKICASLVWAGQTGLDGSNRSDGSTDMIPHMLGYAKIGRKQCLNIIYWNPSF